MRNKNLRNKNLRNKNLRNKNLSVSYLFQEILKLNTEIYKARKTKAVSNILNKILIFDNINIDLNKHRLTKVLREKINKRELLLNTFKTIKLL